jgi:hypothetical protein
MICNVNECRKCTAAERELEYCRLSGYIEEVVCVAEFPYNTTPTATTATSNNNSNNKTNDVNYDSNNNNKNKDQKNPKEIYNSKPLIYRRACGWQSNSTLSFLIFMGLCALCLGMSSFAMHRRKKILLKRFNDELMRRVQDDV